MAKGTVCVTGAGGFIASWLVKLLLSRGYQVHGTVRDPGDKKNDHLRELENASENLKLFVAGLLDPDSLTAAIVGCEGVFHVASPVPSTKTANPEVDVLAPALTGTLNVLKASKNAGVKKVVFVSSLSAVAVNPSLTKGQMVDENCWSDVEYCRSTESWYFLSKTLAERDALEYAKTNELDFVSICPSTVFGPLLQSTVNASSAILLNLLKGARENIDNTVWFLADVRDVAESLILVYENTEAKGRYICSSYRIKMDTLVDSLKSMFPQFKYPKVNDVEDREYMLSSEKLQELGWKIRPLEEFLKDSVESYIAAGLLNK